MLSGILIIPASYVVDITIIPSEPVPVAVPKVYTEDLTGDKVKIAPPKENPVTLAGQQSAYDAYLFCREAKNWQTQKEQSQCCNVRCSTECGKYYGASGYDRDYQMQDDFSTCKQTWCEDICRRSMWDETQ